jgi:hypothetical protein
MPECLFSGHLGGRKNRSRDCALRRRKQSQCCARHDVFYFTGASRGRLALSDGNSRFICSGETLIPFRETLQQVREKLQFFRDK